MRTTTIRVNETERDLVKEVRDEYFEDYPLGAVVKEIADAYDEQSSGE